VATLIGADENIFVGLDLGTTKVAVLVGHLDAERKLRIIGAGMVPSTGMKKGGVVNLEAVAKAIEIAKDKAERTSGYEISSALVSLSGSQIESMNSRGMAGVTGRTIGYDDIARSLEAARSIAIPFNRELVHVVPRSFSVDGQDGIRSAVGMYGYRLEVEAHIVTANASTLRNLEKCIEAAGIAVDGYVLSSLAAGELVLSETEREMGVVVCDIGGGTCDIGVYIEGASWHSSVIPVGGDHLTSDIAQGLHLPQETAETVKLRHGTCRPTMGDHEQLVTLRPFGQGNSIQIRIADLAAILEPRVEEIFGLVRQEIKRSGYDALLPAGVVLTGGSSRLPGIDLVAGDVLQMPVRMAQPENLRGLVEKLYDPSFSASVGLLHWGQLQEEQSVLDHRSMPWPRFDLGRAASFLKRLLPG
jgi:cell division protein FtsA